MENVNITYKNIKGLPDKSLLIELSELYCNIFEDADLIFFKNRITEQTELFSVLAFHNNILIGFKIGYPYNDSAFYSWIGGVTLMYRKQGVATKLAKLQEVYAKKEGFKKLRTKSMNAYKPMMILNLKNGFDIKQVYTNDKGQTKIFFEKDID